MRKILLTGATGLVGKDVLRALLKNDHAIYCLGRTPPALHKNLKFFPADLSQDNQSVLQRLSVIDTVVHLAAHIGGNNPQEDSLLYQKVNIEFTQSLFKFCQIRSVSKVIYLSSLSLLKKPLAAVIDENHRVEAVSLYAQSKRKAEELLFEYSDKHFDPIALRISSPLPVHYKDLPNTVVKKWIDQALAKKTIEVFGSGSRTQDFVSMQDIALAIVKSIQAPQATGIFHIASGKMISMRQLAEKISRHFNQTPIKFVGIDPNENDRWNISIKKAQKELGFFPQIVPEEMLEQILNSAYENSHT